MALDTKKCDMKKDKNKNWCRLKDFNSVSFLYANGAHGSSDESWGRQKELNSWIPVLHL